MKKQLTIYFLFLACFLQLGHSLFPHTHVKEHQHDGTNHHHHHHDTDSDSEEKGISMFFSHFHHNSDLFSTNHLENIVKVVNEVTNAILVVSNTSCYSNLLVLRPKKELQFHKEPLVIISPHLYSLKFRGPPSLI
jgi:hypothetical protein